MKNGRVGMADTTDFSIRCEILADVWMDYREEDGFKELIDFADLGFPLAYCVYNQIVEALPHAVTLIDETFELLLQTMNVEDTGFENLTHLLDTVDKKNNL